jgi:internalin A
MAEKGEPKRMTRQEFRALCARDDREDNPDSADLLLGILHQFGSLFHDEALLGDLIIIDQNGALRAIYAVFDRAPGGPFNTLRNRMMGRFTNADLGRLVWDDHDPSEEQDAFIAMMQACSVAFPLRAAQGEDETLYLAPELLPAKDRIAHEIALRWSDQRSEWRAIKAKREGRGDILKGEEYLQFEAAEYRATDTATIQGDLADTLHARSLGDIPRIRFA